MPELPEVEYARRQLSRWLRGATITAARVLDPRIVEGKVGALVGRQVEKVDRRGKWLRLTLDDGLLAYSHLGMTGKWVRGKDDAPLRHEKLRLDAEKGGRARAVRYLDPRMFGTFVVARAELPAWAALGPDPLHDGLDAAALHARLQKRSGPVKPALLDQALVAGVGNIQATEALWMARIDPRRSCKALARREVGAIARAIDRSIRRTLALESGPEISYVEEPGAENPFLVYGRAGEPCPRCEAKLSSLQLGGRTTAFCPRCQR